MSKFFKVALGVLCVASIVSATIGESEYTAVFDSSWNAGETIDWYPNNYYYLAEPVYIDSAETLVIHPGTWIFGGPGTPGQGGSGGDLASALVVARGGYLIARGTIDSPIVFTAKGDSPSDPYDLGPGAKSMWGGVVMLGRAQINNPDGVGAFAGMHDIEGLDNSDIRSWYGSSEPTYNEESSGELRYVSIRHGGAVKISNEEVNGLTMGGVGSGTDIDYVEVFANADDGYEWFGGTVNAKHLVSAFCLDDAFDYDEGWRGKGQFWFAINQANEGHRLGEHDGMNSNFTDSIWSEPYISNVTYIGCGQYSGTDEAQGIVMRDSAGGHYRNVIITETDDVAFRSYEAPDWPPMPWGANRSFDGGIFWNCGENTWATVVRPDSDSTQFISNDVGIVDPQLLSISRSIRAPYLDPRPCDTSIAYDANYMNIPWSGGGFFDRIATDAQFAGAFQKPSATPNSANSLWIRKWTALAEMDVLVKSANISMRGFVSYGRGQFQIQLWRKAYLGTGGAELYINGADSSNVLSPLYYDHDGCGYSNYTTKMFTTPAHFGNKGEVKQVIFKGWSGGTQDTLRDTTEWILK